MFNFANVYHLNYNKHASSSSRHIVSRHPKRYFDSVPHNELLVKLREAGIGKLWRLFIYLKGQQQIVLLMDSSHLQLT